MLILDIINIIKRTREIQKKDLLGLKNKALGSDYFWLKLKELQKKYMNQEFNSFKSSFGFTLTFLQFETLVYLFNEIFVENQYYFYSTNESPLIIDCGSNIGMSIFYFKTLYPKANIISFEPFEPAYIILKENIERNCLEDVSIFQFVLSDKEEETNIFYIPEKLGSLSMSTISERVNGKSMAVRSVCLSKFIQSEVDFVKMDIEGAELSVIQELSKSGKMSFIKKMLIEYHHHIKKDDDNFSLILSILEMNNFGYQITSSSYPPFQEGKYQDILIFAYKKDNNEKLSDEPS